jgi:hypothetical protein
MRRANGTTLEKIGDVRAALLIAPLAWLASACSSVTDVDVGAGRLPPIYVEAQFVNLPSATHLSVVMETEFLSTDDVRVLHAQLAGAYDAIDSIDFRTIDLTLGGPDGDPLGAEVAEGVRVSGARLAVDQRSSLPEAARNLVIANLRAEHAVVLPVGVELSAASQAMPSAVTVGMSLQPILVMQALKAL